MHALGKVIVCQDKKGSPGHSKTTQSVAVLTRLPRESLESGRIAGASDNELS